MFRCDSVPIIRSNNCVYATLVTCHSEWMTIWYARWNTRQSSIQSDKYQVSHKYSWWWAQIWPKYLQKTNKYNKKNCVPSWLYLQDQIQCVPLATEPGISLIILTPIKILQRNLKKSNFVVWEMKRNVSVVCVCSAPSYCDTEQPSASQPSSVASGTHCIIVTFPVKLLGLSQSRQQHGVWEVQQNS